MGEPFRLVRSPPSRFSFCAQHTYSFTHSSSEWSLVSDLQSVNITTGNFTVDEEYAFPPFLERYSSTRVDHNGSVCLYIFGGHNGINLTYNDVWRFNSTSKRWKWLIGDGVGFTGSYTGSNIPPRQVLALICPISFQSNSLLCRSHAVMVWNNNSESLMIFGGTGSTGNAMHDVVRVEAGDRIFQL